MMYVPRVYMFKRTVVVMRTFFCKRVMKTFIIVMLIKSSNEE